MKLNGQGNHLPPPPFWRTRYYEATRSKPGRAVTSYGDVASVLAAPIRIERQADGRVRHGGWIPRLHRWLRVVTLEDGKDGAQLVLGPELQAVTGEPVIYDPETDTLLVEIRPWPSPLPAEVNEEVGGEDAGEGLVIHYGPDGVAHAYEVEHTSERPDLVARALFALRAAKGFAA